MNGEGLTEREKLQREIEQIKLALQASNEAETSSDEGSEAGGGGDADALMIDTDNEFPNDDPRETHRNDFSQVVLQDSKKDGASHEWSYQIEDRKRNEVIKLRLEENGDLPVTPEASLVLNRAYQEILHDTLVQLHAALSENRKRQNEIQESLQTVGNKKEKDAGRGKLLVSSFTTPYFKDSQGLAPPLNQDALEKKRNVQWLLETTQTRHRIWRTSEKKALHDAVKADCIQQLMRPLMNQKEIEYDKLNKCADKEGQEFIKKKIEGLSEQIKVVSKMPDREVFEKIDDVNKIDWMKIESIDFDGKISANSLQLMWSNCINPLLNHGKWTVDEDLRLTEIVEKHKKRNWTQIAAELGTNRKPFQCLQRYQGKFHRILKGKWTVEEDKLLCSAVKKCTYSGVVNWSEVTEHVPGRMREQCYRRYHVFDPNIKRGKWTPGEDMRLLSAVKRYGEDWIRVSKFTPGRTHNQCRERYQNSLDPSLNMGDWTYEEDKKLLMLVGQHNAGQWAKIAQSLEGRTDNMVLQRYRRLMSWKKQCEFMSQQPAEGRIFLKKGKDLSNSVVFYNQVRKGKMEKINVELKLAKGLPDSEVKYIKYVHNAAICKLLMETNEKRQDELLGIIRDINNGIVIPCPTELKFSTRRSEKVLEKRRMMYNMINENVELAKSSGKAVEGKKGCHREISSMASRIQKLSPILQERLKKVGIENLSVKELLEISEQLEKTRGTKGRFQQFRTGRSSGRPRKIPEDQVIENAICKFFAPRLYKHVKAGRPRKSKVIFGEEEDTDTARLQREKKVTSLLLQAMNVDIKSCLPFGLHTLRKKQAEQEFRQMREQEKEDGGARKRKVTSMHEYIEEVETKKRIEEMEKEISLMQQITGSTAVPSTERQQNQQKVGEVSESTQKTMAKYVLEKVGPPPPLPDKRSANYSLPPLPPNLTTLKGFTTLLLQRRILENFSRQKKKRSNQEEAEQEEENPTQGNSAANQITNTKETHDYKLLKSRVYSVFLWPAFLSALQLPKMESSEKRGWMSAFDEKKANNSNPSTSTQESAAPQNEKPRFSRKTQKAYKKRYPCSRGSRFRKFAQKARSEKVELVNKYLSRGASRKPDENPDHQSVSDEHGEVAHESGETEDDTNKSKEKPENATPQTNQDAPVKRGPGRPKGFRKADFKRDLEMRPRSSRLQSLEERKNQEKSTNIQEVCQVMRVRKRRKGRESAENAEGEIPTKMSRSNVTEASSITLDFTETIDLHTPVKAEGEIPTKMSRSYVTEASSITLDLTETIDPPGPENAEGEIPTKMSRSYVTEASSITLELTETTDPPSPVNDCTQGVTTTTNSFENCTEPVTSVSTSSDGIESALATASYSSSTEVVTAPTTSSGVINAQVVTLPTPSCGSCTEVVISPTSSSGVINAQVVTFPTTSCGSCTEVVNPSTTSSDIINVQVVTSSTTSSGGCTEVVTSPTTNPGETTAHTGSSGAFTQSVMMTGMSGQPFILLASPSPGGNTATVTSPQSDNLAGQNVASSTTTVVPASSGSATDSGVTYQNVCFTMMVPVKDGQPQAFPMLLPQISLPVGSPQSNQTAGGGNQPAQLIPTVSVQSLQQPSPSPASQPSQAQTQSNTATTVPQPNQTQATTNKTNQTPTTDAEQSSQMQVIFMPANQMQTTSGDNRAAEKQQKRAENTE